MARLLHLSDLHAVAPGERASGVLDTPAILRRAIDRIGDRLERIGPVDAVLVTGDLSDDGSVGSYVAARSELERLGLPLLAVPGNHDAREAMRSVFADLPQMPAEGPIDWVLDIGETRVVGLDTLVEGQGGGRLRDESLDLLASAVAGDRNPSIVVALHHPPITTGIRFMDRIALENPEALVGALAGCRTPARVVAGHVHGVYHGLIGPCPVSTAPSLCSAFVFDRREDAPVGFRLGPTGYAVMDTAVDGVWTAVPLEYADGPFPF